jgi:GH18 family chitinase
LIIFVKILVDIDWEWPDNQGTNIGLLMEALYTLLHPRGYLVTIAVGADINKAPIRYDFELVDKNVDFINLVSENFF